MANGGCPVTIRLQDRLQVLVVMGQFEVVT